MRTIKMLDISTLHVSRETRALLDAPHPWPAARQCDEFSCHQWLSTGGTYINATPFEYGWFVYALDERDLPETVESSYPPDLLAIFRLARAWGCDWVKIDRDGEQYAYDDPDVCVAGLYLYDEDGHG